METQHTSTPNLAQFDAAVVAFMEKAVPGQIAPITLSVDVEKAHFDQTGFPGRVLRAKEKGLVQLQLDVLSAIVADGDAYDLVAALQPQLAPLGYQILLTANSDEDFCRVLKIRLREAIEKYDEKAMIVVFKAPTVAPLLWVRQTNGENYDVRPSEIIHKLAEWSKLCEIRVIGAGHEWLEFELVTLPTDMLALADDIYDFCPDILEQNVLRPAPEGLSREELLDFIEEVMDEQDTEDLAAFLKREKRVFLRWD